MKRLFFALAACVYVSAMSADEGRLLRFPATNGSEVVFTYGGDLYRVSIDGGAAERLTSHVGYELFARYSPDGSRIAFTGEYDGNREVYVIPAEGGTPVRVTFTGNNPRDDVGDRMGPNNIVMTWTPDGDSIIFRNRISDSFDGQLWAAPLDGGMPKKLPLPEGGFCSFSPDGTKMAYNRVFREFRTWKYYRGGMADDIWIYDGKAGKVTNVTENDAQDIAPMWYGDEIFFISDRDMTMNIFAYNTVTGQTDKITMFTDYDVKFPSIGGGVIVFENGGYLYKLDPVTRSYEKITVALNAENIYARPERKQVDDNVEGASLSPDGRRIAVSARGEVFDVPVAKGVTRNITRTSGANDREAAWSPDGKYIAYISDVTGETEVYLQPIDGDVMQLTSGNDTYIRSLQWSPDGKTVLYTDRKNRIVVVDIASKAKRTVMQNPEGEFREVAYSPDSKWIAYTKPASNDMSVVYVYNLETGKEIAVTERWYDSRGPVFSSDGKYLVFVSNRDLHPTYSRTEWNHAYTAMGGIYLALLSKDTPSPFLPKDGDDGGDKPQGAPGKDGFDNGPKGKNGSDKKAETQQDVTVKIDEEGLVGRIVKLQLREGDFFSLFSDGRNVWYSAREGIHVYDLEAQKDEISADHARLISVSKDSKAIVMKREEMYVVDLKPGKMMLDKGVDLSEMCAVVDYKAEWAQLFDEAWRAFRDGFYLENMHGVDWNAIRAKYEPLVPYAATRLDINYVIGEMISELACGHAYITPGEYAKPERIEMGLLGAEFSRDAATGFFRIKKILHGAPYSDKLRSPLAEPGMAIEEGDYITAIDGVPVTTVNNIYALLVGKAGVLTELSVNSAASAAGAHKVVVTPIADEYPLYHYEWVQRNIETVDKATDGRVGYIFIPDMGPEGLNEFARYFYPQLDKEALIIDDRGNGGGNVSPMIIERLQRKAYRMTMSRVSTRTGTIPDATHHGPKVLLVDKYSASDGDLFPWSFKANGLGTVIGTRTWGGIIGISGSLPYIDGTDIRVPFFTNYDAVTGQWFVENHGVDPDIVVDNDPIKAAAGEDEQLQKAIEVALEQLKSRVPLPGVPAPRTFKDLGLPE